MSGKSVSISVRLSTNDAAFLAGYDSSGATSLSEKVRALIAEAKQRQLGTESYRDSLNMVNALIAPSMHQLHDIEASNNMHSELLLALAQWLPDATATIISGLSESRDNEGANQLKKLESLMADRIFLLIEKILRLGVTGESPCYDAGVITSRVSTVVKLSKIINDSSN